MYKYAYVEAKTYVSAKFPTTKITYAYKNTFNWHILFIKIRNTNKFN